MNDVNIKFIIVTQSVLLLSTIILLYNELYEYLEYDYTIKFYIFVICDL